jgi:hypothetical protein
VTPATPDESQNPPHPLTAWARPRYLPGGGDALLYYAVLGEFPADFALTLDRGCHRVSDAATSSVLLEMRTRADHPRHFDDLLGGAIGRLLDAEYAALSPHARRAPALVSLRADVPDPADLLYLRDAVGLVAALLDAGGVAVLDAMALEWWTPDDFRSVMWEPDRADPLRHATILVSEDERDAQGRPTVWVHTRGMRKFGRPDVSVRGVSERHLSPVVEMCNRLIAFQARGGIVPEGEAVRVPGLPPGITLHHAGDPADPDFNNVHLAARWPPEDAAG